MVITCFFVKKLSNFVSVANRYSKRQILNRRMINKANQISERNAFGSISRSWSLNRFYLMKAFVNFVSLARPSFCEKYEKLQFQSDWHKNFFLKLDSKKIWRKIHHFSWVIFEENTYQSIKSFKSILQERKELICRKHLSHSNSCEI